MPQPQYAHFGQLAAFVHLLQDKNTLLAWAVNPDMRVAFDHWKGEAQGRDSDGESKLA